MSQQKTFGRRRSEPAALHPPPTTPDDPMAMSQAAEAFRSDLRSQPRGGSDFDVWRRDQRGRRLVAWTLRFALFTPGFVCLVLQTPWYVSGGLELAGMGVGWWLRLERRRHLKEIADWSSEAC